MIIKIFWTSRDWAAAVAQMPVQGSLPCRTVLVPRGRVAHVLRRKLIRAGRSDALAGTRFVLAPAAAVEVLRAADSFSNPVKTPSARPGCLRSFARICGSSISPSICCAPRQGGTQIIVLYREAVPPTLLVQTLHSQSGLLGELQVPVAMAGPYSWDLLGQ